MQINTISLNKLFLFFISLSDTASLAGHTKGERPRKVNMDVYKKEESNCLEQGKDGVHLLDRVLIMFGKSRFKA